MEKLRIYIIKLNNNYIIKLKIYLLNCVIKSKNYQFIIVIIHDSYIFSTNDNI